jgi:hypothetical protein
MTDMKYPLQPNFVTALAKYNESPIPNEPMPVSDNVFSTLGGKTEDMAIGYLYELHQKHGDEIFHRLSECRRLFLITFLAYVGLPNDISIAFRVATAVSSGELESKFFKQSMSREDIIDFLDHMVLMFLVTASIMKIENNLNLMVEHLFESSEAHRLSDFYTHHVKETAFSEDLSFSALASYAAKKRYEKDDKQADKRFVFECWSEWRKNPGSYKSKAAFARDMQDKFPNLESQKVIEDWCRQWEKGVPH